VTFRKGIRELGLALITAGAVLGLLHFDTSSLLRGLETASLDLRFRVRGVLPPGPELALVMVDDRSIDALGRWPLSRRLFAKALGILDRGGARVIVMDLLFAQPEQPVAPRLRVALNAAAAALPDDRNDLLRAELRSIAADDPDGEFASAIHASGKVLLPIAFAFTGAAKEAPANLSDASYQRFAKTAHPPAFPLQPVSATVPLEPWATAAAGLGHVNIAFDRDGAPRYDYAALPFAGDFVPSLPMRAAAAHLGVPWTQVALVPGEGVRLGPIAIPTDPAMRLLINYRGPRGTFPTFSFVDLIEGRVPAAAINERTILIGASFLGLADANASPFGSTQLPGTERMANIIEMILRGDFIRESPPGWPLMVTLGVLLLAATIGLGAAVLPTHFAAVAAIVPIGAWVVWTQLAFQHGMWLPLVNPLIALVITTLTVLLFRYRTVDYEGRIIKSAFRRYLAPDMVNYLAKHPDNLKLGGETRCLSLLFCDLRGFTAISERYKSDPHALTELLHRFLTPMTDLILARRGTIDKYMGDCIMAFWNAPLDDAEHADHACAAALAIIAELERVNTALAAEAAAGHHEFEPLKVGIGLNTGECIVGNMGSDQRFDYSVLGDAVNLAARLETQSKTYQIAIVIGEGTRALAPSWAAIELDWITVYGKQEAVQIYTLLGDTTFAQSAEFKALHEDHEAMLACYRAQDWPGATAALARCRGREASLEPLYDLYQERIAYYRSNPPDPDWDGVFVASTK
jgi:adenylate cyclase